MVEGTGYRTVVMSIHPEFVRAILSGKKKVEFRKTRFSTKVSHVVIYATFPMKKIVGYFEINKIDTACPNELWARYKNVAGIKEDSFYAYYKNYSCGIAIEIGQVYKLDKYIPLSFISSSAPPQNYSYLSQETFNSFLGMTPKETDLLLK